MVFNSKYRYPSLPWSCQTVTINQFFVLIGLQLRVALFRIVKYCSYWLNCVDQHSLHAPFSYKVYKSLKSSGANPAEFEEIEKLRKALLTTHTAIQITDYGAGSMFKTSISRKISSLAKSSLTPPKYSQLYYKLIEFCQAETILELGTSLGVNTLYLAAAATVKQVITIEGCPSIAEMAAKNFKMHKIQVIKSVVGRIEDEINDQLTELGEVDFVLFDANHTYEATISYFEICMPFAHENSVFVFDDIYWSQGMSRAWNQIKNDHRVTLSLDFYRTGVVFFKKNLVKENLVLMI